MTYIHVHIHTLRMDGRETHMHAMFSDLIYDRNTCSVGGYVRTYGVGVSGRVGRDAAVVIEGLDGES
jgi:hypothetical protein